MKKLLILIVFVSQITWGQTPAAVQQDLMNFKTGELIVKLKDNVDAGVTYADNGKAMSSFNIGELLGIEDKIESSSVMFHQKSIEASIVNKEKMKAIYAAKAAANPNNGYVPKEPLTMKNIFVLKTNNEQENILMLIEEIKNNPNVEYAEPNYIYSIDDFEVGETIYDETTDSESEQESSETSDATIDVDDPLYSSQTNITSTNIDDVWEQYTTGDGSQVIAILDSGVDYTHPDLEANIWNNTEELNGVEGYDDDGNGYIDDIRGWDFINIDNAPLDDNMHGTHVAGIAGAVGNNGIGIAGAAWNVKLMPIKVFQSTGQGSSVTIAEGIEYATNNGATILNMSFGGGQSATMLAALENAYSTAILVASSGNNNIKIGPCLLCAPHFPAAYPFVIGVQDLGTAGAYDNWDQDGPIATEYINLLNYETNAPGTQIISTVPNGGYGIITGTSMATPLVAGGIALYKQQDTEASNELILGNIINTKGDNYIDFLSAIQSNSPPKLVVVNKIYRDTINNQNGNTFLEPGETVEILPLIKNYWGPSEDVRVGIEFAEFEDQNKATIIQNEIQIGSISAYASLQDLYNTLKITIAGNVENNVDIRFDLRVWSGPDQDYMSDPTEIVINVKNSILLYGNYTTDLTLTADKEYLVTDNFSMGENTTLTVMPGVELYVSPGKTIMILGDINAIGTNQLPILFTGLGSSSYGETWSGFKLYGDSVFKYCTFSRVWSTVFQQMTQYWNTTVDKCIFTDIGAGSSIVNEGRNTSFTRNNIIDNYQLHPGGGGYTIGGLMWEYNNFINNMQNNTSNNVVPTIIRPDGNSNIYTPLAYNNFFNNYPNMDINTIPQSFTLNSSINATMTHPNYFGSSNTETVNSSVIDFTEDGSLGVLELNISTSPSDLANGIVWKVLVNGKDAQDEYALMDPVGVGPHEFKVYFNRAMNTTIDPQVSYGVAFPYNQKIISETGTWSTDGKIYTVTHDVNVGAADGYNRIRVQGAQDLDYFVIPVEAARFNMLIQSAGSASAGWFATPGLGKIALTWEAPDANEIDDALGYNMYRYQIDADGVESTPVKLNESLIVEDSDDSTTGVYYSDFDVVQGQTYFYKYNILRTSFEVTDFSSVVSSTPLTSTLGDSNGDSAVDVLDLVHDVDYILGNNPTPFIFLAGDVNADNAINVLDIVGTVDIILNPSDATDSSIGSTDIQFYPSNSIGNAVFTWEGNDLYVEADHNIGGLQLAFSNDFEYTVSSELSTIEKLDYIQDDTKVVMLFSFNNTVIADGKTKLLTRLDESKELNIDLAVVGTTSGSKLTAVFEDTNLEDIESPLQSDSLEFLSMIPNPTSGLVSLNYYLPEQMDGVVAKVYDMLGRLVHIQAMESNEGASNSQMQLNNLQKGNYIVLISADKNGGTKHIANKMLIIK